jgi:hypothetical protein
MSMPAKPWLRAHWIAELMKVPRVLGVAAIEDQRPLGKLIPGHTSEVVPRWWRGGVYKGGKQQGAGLTANADESRD